MPCHMTSQELYHLKKLIQSASQWTRAPSFTNMYTCVIQT